LATLEERLAEAPNSPLDLSTSMAADPTILVVDDSTTVRNSTSRLLRLAGYRVVEASNVGLALKQLDELSIPPVAVVSDVAMPGLSVRTLIRAVRDYRPRIPILLMSGGIEEARVQEMVDAGEVPLLAKPFTWEELLRALRTLVGA
jgi:CheY-like chemotaxis protein